MKTEQITYQQLLNEPYITYTVEWKQLGSIINHKHVFHDSRAVKEYILNLEKRFPNVTYTIMKQKRKRT